MKKASRFLFLIFLFAYLPFVGIAQALSGSYTVGGTSPNYPSIDSAISAVEINGVKGPVILKIRPGTYNETVQIDSAKGLSDTNTLTLRPDAAFTGKVIWKSSGTPVTLRSTHDIIIENLEIETTSPRTVIYFLGNCDRIKIKANTLRGLNVNNNWPNHTIVYSPSGFTNLTNDITVDNNIIINGSTGVHYDHSGSSNPGQREVRNTISNNYFEGQTKFGIRVDKQDTLLVKNNSIISSSMIKNGKGIEFNLCYNFIAERNSLNLGSSDHVTGIYFWGCSGTKDNPIIFKNNYIQLSNGHNGAWLNDTDTILTLNNTIRIKGNVAGSSCLTMVNNDAAELLNNNFYNGSESGFALVLNQTKNASVLDYNNYFVRKNHGAIIHVGNSNYSDIFSWRKFSKKDSNSFFVNPYFQSKSGPVPNNVFLNNSGKSLIDVKVDIDSNQRSSSPDIGCIEFGPTINDAGISSIHDSVICTGGFSIGANLKNYGIDTLKSATIDWEIIENNKVLPQTAISWSGRLISYKTTILNLGQFNFKKDSTYALKVFVTSANGGTDSLAFNDTSITSGLKTGMSGTYTIGGTSPDYSRLDYAITDLERLGICGPIKLNIRPGTIIGYTNIGFIAGTDSVNTITLQTDPDSIKIAEIEGTLNLTQCRDWRFENLRFKHKSGNTSISMIRSNYNIVVKKCELLGDFVKNSTYRFNSPVYIGNGGSLYEQQNEKIIIDSNVIKYASIGVYCVGKDTNISSKARNIVIRNNVIDSSTYKGVVVRFGLDVLIQNNKIEVLDLQAQSSGISGIGCSGFKADRNKIVFSNYSGIDITESKPSSSTPLLLSNNFIIAKPNANTANQYGIRAIKCKSLNVLNNSIRTNSGGRYSSVAYQSSSNVNQVVKNNIFCHANGGYAQSYYLPSGITEIDHNVNWSSGTVVFRLGGTDYSTLTAWKTAMPSVKNSLFTDPKFLSPTNLHIFNKALKAKGDTVLEIKYDFDGELRNSYSPDIGADEFRVYAADVRLQRDTGKTYCSGPAPISVSIYNNGTATITTAKIQWTTSENGGVSTQQQAYNFTGSLNPGKDTSIVLGNYTLNRTSSYKVIAYVDIVNGGKDSLSINDTLAVYNGKASFSGVYKVGSSNSTWTTVDSAFTDLEKYGICGPVTIYVKSGRYSENVSIDSIPGISQSNWVTLLGDTTSATKPEIVSTVNTLVLSNVSFFTMRNMKVTATRSSAGIARAVYLDNSSGVNHDLLFDNNEFVGAKNLNGSGIQHYHATFLMGPFTKAPNPSNITIENNKSSYGSYSFSIVGGQNKRLANLIVRNNTCLDFSYVGINVGETDSCLIFGNTIGSSANFGVYGLFCGNILRTKITNNKIKLKGGGTGIYVVDFMGTPTNYGLVANNFVSVGGSGTSYGIQSWAGYVDIIHNSVHMYSTRAGTYALDLYGSTYLNAKNNIFYHSANGPVVRARLISQKVEVDYNNYYTTNSRVFSYYNNRDENSFAAWKSVSKFDSNSLNLLPYFKDTFDLHITQVKFIRAGSKEGLLEDIDGDLRDTTTPDIGADELGSPPHDAKILAIERGSCSSGKSIFIKIKNTGPNQIDSLRITWQQKPQAGGSYSALKSKRYRVTIPSKGEKTVFFNDTSLLTGNYIRLRAIVDSVNGVKDQFKPNDTLIVDSLIQGLSGVYTVGGAKADFSSINNATNALHKYGVCSHVTFRVNPGIYNEELRISHEINGTGYNGTVSFIGVDSNGTFPTLRDTHNVLTLKEIDWVRLRNFNFIQIPDPNYSQGVTGAIGGDMYNAIVESCNFYGNVDSAGRNGGDLFGISGASYGNVDSVLIRNCLFENGNDGVGISSSLRQNRRSSRIWFDNNSIKVDNEALLVTYVDSLFVTNNLIEASDTSTKSFYGIYVSTCHKYIVESNKLIIDRTPATGKIIMGIHCAYLQTAGPTTNRISNNFISIKTGSITSAGAFYLNNTDEVDVVHNSILIKGGGVNSYVLWNTRGWGPQNKTFLYNSAFVDGPGMIFRESSRPIAILQSDYNNLYTKGSVFGNMAGNYSSSFSAWKTSTGLDGNSISVDPQYFSITDLHTFSADLDGAARINMGVVYDIDNEIRNTTNPDIGADEFVRRTRDGGLTLKDSTARCIGRTAINVVFKNHGMDTIKRVKINWEISENSGAFVTQSPLNWSGSLGLAKDTLLTLGSYSFSPRSTYRLLFFIDSVNGGLDSNKTNDTLKVEFQIDSLPVINFSTLPAICANAPSFSLTQASVLPNGGTGSYFGIGVNAGKFDPGVSGRGLWSIGYTNTTLQGCADTAYRSIQVDSIPQIAYSLPDSICEKSQRIAVNTATPIGGIYSGVISNGFFIPVTVGNFKISYQYTDSNSCADSIVHVIRVNSKPIVTLNTLKSICENDSSLVLLGGRPTGGLYYGNSIVAGTFSPNLVGKDTVNYQFTNSKGCSDTAIQQIRVKPKPAVTFGLLNPGCELDSNVFIGYGGLPIAGNYYSSFTTNDTFNTHLSGIGIHQVYYTFRDTNRCSDTAVSTIEIESNPVFSLGNDTAICAAVQISLDPKLSGMRYKWSTGDTVQSIITSRKGIKYSLEITDPSTQANCAFTDIIEVDTTVICVGIAEIHKNFRVKLFPNPVGSHFFVTSDCEYCIENLQIYDAGGKLVADIILEEIDQKKIKVSTTNLAVGNYQVSMLIDGKQENIRFIVTR